MIATETYIPMLIIVEIAIVMSGCSTKDERAVHTHMTMETGERPRSLEAGQLGISSADLAVANADSDTVSILYPIGQGELDGLEIPAGNEPSDVNIEDIDNDGDNDLIVANHETSNIVILLQTEKGWIEHLQSPLKTPALPHLHGLATGDFDGDGWIDIAADSSDTNSVVVTFGGAEGFSHARSVPAGEFPYYRIDAFDLDGDGQDEIIVPSPRANTVSILKHSEGHSFTVETINVPGGPTMVVGGDVNGDGIGEIAMQWSDTTAIYHRKEAGAPYTLRGALMEEPSVTEIALGDFDADGLLDLAIGPWDGREVVIYPGDGSAVRRIDVCERPVGLAILKDDRNTAWRGLAAACSLDNKVMIVNY